MLVIKQGNVCKKSALQVDTNLNVSDVHITANTTNKK